jgi:hypothetical protein
MSKGGERNGREHRIHSILMPWLETNGVSHPFELRSFGLEGFGLVAKQEIKVCAHVLMLFKDITK